MTDEHITSFTNSFDELGALAVLDGIEGGFAIGVNERPWTTLRAVMEPLSDMSQAVFADKSAAGTRANIVEKDDDEESMITGIKEVSKPISVSVERYPTSKSAENLFTHTCHLPRSLGSMHIYNLLVNRKHDTEND